MIVLHIASVKENMFNGVCVAVPQHILAQSNYANVGFINVTNIPINEIPNQFKYTKDFSIESLPYPFSSPDIVIFHEVYRMEYLQLYRQIYKNGIPYIIVPHGCLSIEAQRKKRFKKIVANNLFFRKYIKKAIAIQCLSQSELNSIKIKKDKFIGTNGINLPNKTKELFGTKEIKLIYIGRLDIYIKGLDIMLDAISTLAHFLRKENVKLYMYGPEYLDWAEKIRNMISERKISDIAILKSAILGEEKEKEILNSDIFIQTSRTEGMPMGILEALAYGVPCIVTQGTNLAEFVKQNNAGWATENTVEGLTEVLQKAITEKNTWAEKSVNARRAIVDEYSWKEVSYQTLNSYKSYTCKKGDFFEGKKR